MYKNTLVLGNGFIASHLNYKIISDRLEPNSKQIKSILEKYKPDAIINCIGFCGNPNIDACQLNPELTFNTNTIIPILLSYECQKLNIKLISISSGCIFYGESPNNYYLRFGDKHYLEDFLVKKDAGWKETDFANPISLYSKSKYAADLAMQNLENVSILRIRMPVSEQNNPRNLINKLRGYKKIIDIPNSMTFVDDLAKVINFFIENDYSGIYNVVNEDPLTAADIMKEYQKYIPTQQFEIISEEQLDQLTTAKRSNCILNSDKLDDLLAKKANFKMQKSKEALIKLMPNYIKKLNN